jgi:signal transduction histidine kinase
VLATEPEWDKVRLRDHVRRVPVRRDHSIVALETELRTLRAEHAALTEAYTHLQEVNHLRQDLVDMLIHDLKNPLSVVLASLEVIADIVGKEAGKDLLELIHIATRSSQEMLQLVTDLLEVKQLESGHFPVHLQPVEIATVLHQAATRVRILAAQKKIDLHMHIPDDLPWIWADLNLTLRLVTNLLENAIRFSPPGEPVVVTVRPGKKEITVTVANNGPPIPVQQQEHIFEKFYQASKDSDAGRGSVGLGLSFCKLAVEAQRGRIWVESNAGTGVQFHFTLPMWQ